MSFMLENVDFTSYLAPELDAFCQTGANLKSTHNLFNDQDNFNDFLSQQTPGESLDADLPWTWFDYQNNNQPQIKTEAIPNAMPIESLPPSMFFQPPNSNQKVKLDENSSDEESDATVKPNKKSNKKTSSKQSNQTPKQQVLGSSHLQPPFESPNSAKRKRSTSAASTTSSRRSSLMETDDNSIFNNSVAKELPKIQKTAHSSQFVPPDTSNLSKREARLLKNRAAAFLSRQRKREAFELLEEKVSELERENAKLISERDMAFAGERRALDELSQLQGQLSNNENNMHD